MTDLTRTSAAERPAGRVVVDRIGSVALLTLNDPARRNALGSAIRAEFITAVDRLEADEQVGALVITGAGTAFCAGADLEDLSTVEPGQLRELYEPFSRVARLALPTVAAVNGPAVGAGLNLALVCDLRIAGKSATFSAPFVKLGLHPGGGNTWMVARLAGLETATALALFTETLDGRAAADHGLVWRCVDDDSLLDEALRLASRAADTPRELVVRLKESLSSTTSLTNYDDALALEADAQAWSARQAFFRDRIAAARAPKMTSDGS